MISEGHVKSFRILHDLHCEDCLPRLSAVGIMRYIDKQFLRRHHDLHLCRLVTGGLCQHPFYLLQHGSHILITCGQL